MVDIHLFGGSTPVGISLYEKVNKFFSDEYRIFKYSRNSKGGLYFDLMNPKLKLIGNKSNSIIISYAPIWDLAFFLENSLKNNEKSLKNFDTIIATSSTSILTKEGIS